MALGGDCPYAEESEQTKDRLRERQLVRCVSLLPPLPKDALNPGSFNQHDPNRNPPVGRDNTCYQVFQKDPIQHLRRGLGLIAGGRRTGTALSGALFGRHDIALPVNTTEYVRTRMAVPLQVEPK